MHYRSLRRMRGNSLWAPTFFVGILAAIAIPAYQDYTIRAKVTEGLNLTGSVKASVAEFYAEHQRWPRDLRELQFESAPRGQYVTFVAVNRGTIVIRYNRAAGPMLQNQNLTLRPTITAKGDIYWGCGYQSAPGQDPASGPATEIPTTLHPKYLPSACRPSF